MSAEGSGTHDRNNNLQQQPATTEAQPSVMLASELAPGGGSGSTGVNWSSPSPVGSQSSLVPSLLSRPIPDHMADSYEDLTMLEYPPELYTSLERFLPMGVFETDRDSKPRFVPVRETDRDSKLRYMRQVLQNYPTDDERAELQKFKEYRQMILSNYQPLHRELYSLDSRYLAPSFLAAIEGKSEESFRNVMTEVSPSIFVFQMLKPDFCNLLMEEVENFKKWVREMKFTVTLPNTMDEFGVVLDDFGLETMLHGLMEDFILPISGVFFSEVGGSSLDIHHGFVAEYGTDRARRLGLHVDDSEVTLNVCLNKEFSGGELYFRGVRCDKHVHKEAQPQEIFDCSHNVPGTAILYRGRHRHGAHDTIGGHRINFFLWCRSSAFREMMRYKKDFSEWCAECRCERAERVKKGSELLKQLE